MSAIENSSEDIEEQQVPSSSNQNDLLLEEHRESWWLKLKQHVPSLRGTNLNSKDVILQHTMEHIDDIKEKIRWLQLSLGSLYSFFHEDEESESDKMMSGDVGNDSDEESL